MRDRFVCKDCNVDESFIDFSDEPSLLTILHDTDQKNVLVLKSLSKVYGVPGLRLGFVYSRNRPLLPKFRSLTPIWNMNSIAEYFLETLFKHRRSLEDSFALTRIDRQNLKEDLATVPGVEEVFPSGANFLLFKASQHRFPPQKTTQELLKRFNIYVKDVTNRMEKKDATYLRVAVRTPSDHQIHIHALRSISSDFGRPNE